jgi:hypothetical protein
MICSQAREHLPALLYGDLGTAEAAALEDHLRGCGGCQREYQALKRVRALLDTVPTPSVRIDVGRLYRQLADDRERRWRRWRRAAALCAGVAAAAAVLAFGPRLEVRVEAHQLVFRWGQPVPAPALAVGVPASRDSDRTSPSEWQVQYQVLSELLQGTGDELAALDQRQQQQVARLQAQLDDHERQAALWRAAVERDLAALSAFQSDSSKKGVGP